MFSCLYHKFGAWNWRINNGQYFHCRWYIYSKYQQNIREVFINIILQIWWCHWGCLSWWMIQFNIGSLNLCINWYNSDTCVCNRFRLNNVCLAFFSPLVPSDHMMWSIKMKEMCVFGGGEGMMFNIFCTCTFKINQVSMSITFYAQVKDEKIIFCLPLEKLPTELLLFFRVICCIMSLQSEPSVVQDSLERFIWWFKPQAYWLPCHFEIFNDFFYKLKQ